MSEEQGIRPGEPSADAQDALAPRYSDRDMALAQQLSSDIASMELQQERTLTMDERSLLYDFIDYVTAPRLLTGRGDA